MKNEKNYRKDLIDAIASGDTKAVERISNIQSGKAVTVRTFYDCLRLACCCEPDEKQIVEELDPEFKKFLDNLQTESVA